MYLCAIDTSKVCTLCNESPLTTKVPLSSLIFRVPDGSNKSLIVSLYTWSESEKKTETAHCKIRLYKLKLHTCNYRLFFSVYTIHALSEMIEYH